MANRTISGVSHIPKSWKQKSFMLIIILALFIGTGFGNNCQQIEWMEKMEWSIYSALKKEIHPLEVTCKKNLKKCSVQNKPGSEW